MNIWLVEEFPECLDSVWDSAEKAEARSKSLDEKNKGQYSSITQFELNVPEGVVV